MWSRPTWRSMPSSRRCQAVPQSKIIFLLRDDGMGAYNLGAGWAQATYGYRVEQIGKLPFPAAARSICRCSRNSSAPSRAARGRATPAHRQSTPAPPHLPSPPAPARAAKTPLAPDESRLTHGQKIRTSRRRAALCGADGHDDQCRRRAHHRARHGRHRPRALGEQGALRAAARDGRGARQAEEGSRRHETEGRPAKRWTRTT